MNRLRRLYEVIVRCAG